MTNDELRVLRRRRRARGAKPIHRVAAGEIDRAEWSGRGEWAMDGLTVAEADLVVYVHPSKANKARHAVLRQLSSLLFT
ncbi:hypothetical protein BHM03_00000321 [Ensete ventricosum]|uniref:Uncharacterized protein n=1 Tax=Ensete ventricosum TaxID=4639 RepID=A0A445M8I1_ENSVE|nr:hypothetical protein BHM03_00000321 [Ensete ventricosum]